MADPGTGLELILKQAQSGDEAAMTNLIALHKSLVYTILYRMTRDRDKSQDLTQETFIRAVGNIAKVKDGPHFKPWLCTIARNLARDHLRQRTRQKTVPLDAVPEPSGPDTVGQSLRRVIIQDALMRLGERDRLILTLVYLKGLTLAEAGAVLRVSTNNAKVTLFRARIKLREQLKGYENELLSPS